MEPAEQIRFIFWETMKGVSLAFVALLAAKAVGGLRFRGNTVQARHQVSWRRCLYLVILLLAAQGAHSIGNNVAAEIYAWSSIGNLSRSQLAMSTATQSSIPRTVRFAR